MQDDIRDVFRDPQAGDAICYFGDDYQVLGVEHRAGKKLIKVRINGQENRQRTISMESWREYRDDATVTVNKSVLDAFD